MQENAALADRTDNQDAIDFACCNSVAAYARGQHSRRAHFYTVRSLIQGHEFFKALRHRLAVQGFHPRAGLQVTQVSNLVAERGRRLRYHQQQAVLFADREMFGAGTYRRTLLL